MEVEKLRSTLTTAGVILGITGGSVWFQARPPATSPAKPTTAAAAATPAGPGSPDTPTATPRALRPPGR